MYVPYSKRKSLLQLLFEKKATRKCSLYFSIVWFDPIASLRFNVLWYFVYNNALVNSPGTSMETQWKKKSLSKVNRFEISKKKVLVFIPTDFIRIVMPRLTSMQREQLNGLRPQVVADAFSCNVRTIQCL